MKPKTFFQIVLTFTLVIGLGWRAAPAQAVAGIVVNSLADIQANDGQCTLREAIINANGDNQAGSVDCAAGVGSDTITFNLSGSIILGAPLPAITSPAGLVIDGIGQSIVIDGNGQWQVFSILPMASLTLQNLSVVNGVTPATGGGAQNFGVLNVFNCVFWKNSAAQGGAIYNAKELGALLMVHNSRIDHNTASVAGGGIYNAGMMNVINSSFTGNTGGDGAGIYHAPPDALPPAIIDSSTFIENMAGIAGPPLNRGGGINNQAQMMIVNSTFTSNNAFQGGGIYHQGNAPLMITNSTLTADSAIIGGEFFSLLGILAVFQNTILANSLAGGECVGPLTDGGNNIDSGVTCGFSPLVGSMSRTNPLLGVMTGLPAYFPLMPLSPAIDAVIWNAPNNCPGVDQRAQVRPQDGNGDGVVLCDIGSYEYVMPPTAFVKAAPLNGAANVSVAPTLLWGTSSNATSYEYCYDTVSGSTCEGTWTSVGNNTSVVLSGLNTSTTYYWQVRAVNAGGTTEADGGTWWSFATVPPAPGAFNKSAPTNGLTNVSTSPTLSWGSSSGAASYEYCYDTVAGSTCESTWTSTGSNTSIALSGLNTNTTYYWQARANNAGGTTEADGGTWWSFTTVPAAPGAFGKSAPVDTATNISTAPTLSWGASSNATAYDYCYDTISGSTCEGTWTSVGTNTSIGLSGLSASTTYYWQVRANNAGGTTEANSGTWWSFTTVPPAPGAFGKSNPTNTATNISTSPTLSWNSSSGAAAYDYCYDTVAGSTCEGTWTSVGNTLFVGLSGLSNGTTYYWQVRAVNTGGTTEADGGTWWSFTTVPPVPDAFSKSAPVDTATNISTAPTLSWGSSSNATAYDYCYDTTAGSTCEGTWTSVGSATSIALSGLSTGTTYYWQVRANNVSGTVEANSGTWWSFTTVPPAPGAFDKSAPANSATWVSLTPTLTWGTSSGAASYDYCYDTSNNSACNTAWVSAGTGTTVNLSGLTVNTTYYWQVRANNAGGSTLANGGTWWSFKTLPPKVTRTYYSIGSQDGWILETGEFTNTGGVLNSTGILTLGDDSLRRQYRSVLSFSTSSLPDTAVIATVTLKLKRVSVVPVGTNPIVLLQGIYVDIRKGFFGTTPALQSGDFQYAATKTAGPFSPALLGGWYTINLNSTTFSSINKVTAYGGLTQFRLHFKLDDNNNAIANLLNLASGNDPLLANKPKLIIEYYAP